MEDLTGVTVVSGEETESTENVETEPTGNVGDTDGVTGTDPDPRLEGINPQIHDGKQGIYVPGHNNEIEGRSQLIPGEDPQDLLDEVLEGDLEVVGEGVRGDPVVDFGRPIGVDASTGEPTQYGTIHSGGKGTHIVPANPNKYGQ